MTVKFLTKPYKKKIKIKKSPTKKIKKITNHQISSENSSKINSKKKAKNELLNNQPKAQNLNPQQDHIPHKTASMLNNPALKFSHKHLQKL